MVLHAVAIKNQIGNLPRLEGGRVSLCVQEFVREFA